MSRDAAIRKLKPGAMPGIDYSVNAETGEVTNWNTGNLGQKPTNAALDLEGSKIDADNVSKAQTRTSDLVLLRGSLNPEMQALVRVMGLDV